MAEIKGEHSLNVSQELPEVSDKNLPKTKRVASLDIFRGLTVAVPLSLFPYLLFGIQINEKPHLLCATEHVSQILRLTLSQLVLKHTNFILFLVLCCFKKFTANFRKNICSIKHQCKLAQEIKILRPNQIFTSQNNSLSRRRKLREVS